MPTRKDLNTRIILFMLEFETTLKLLSIFISPLFLVYTNW